MRNLLYLASLAFALSLIGKLEAAPKTTHKFLPKSFKAVFKQTYRSSLSGTLKSSTGNIDYRFPGHIRFETKKPNHIVFVSNKYKTWYYTAPYFKGEKGDLSIQGASKNVLTRFFDVLQKGLKSNDLYTVKKLKNSYKLIFSKKTKKEVGVKDASLVFKSNTPSFSALKELNLTYLNKKKVKLTLSKIQANYNFKRGHFFFKVPKNTKIIKR